MNRLFNRNKTYTGLYNYMAPLMGIQIVLLRKLLLFYPFFQNEDRKIKQKNRIYDKNTDTD